MSYPNEWVSVKKKLPREDGRYLVHRVLCGYHWYDVLSFAKDARKVDKYDFHDDWKNVWYKRDSEYGYFTLVDVTHWMPLPEAPKEDI